MIKVIRVIRVIRIIRVIQEEEGAWLLEVLSRNLGFINHHSLFVLILAKQVSLMQSLIISNTN